MKASCRLGSLSSKRLISQPRAKAACSGAWTWVPAFRRAVRRPPAPVLSHAASASPGRSAPALSGMAPSSTSIRGAAERASATEPSNTFRPPAISTTRSHRRSACCITWVEKTTAAPLAARLRSRSSSVCWAIGSRPEKGSSRITSSGSWARALSSCTLCAMPLERCRTCRRAAWPRPFASSSSMARLRARAGGMPFRPAKKTMASTGVIRR